MDYPPRSGWGPLVMFPDTSVVTTGLTIAPAEMLLKLIVYRLTVLWSLLVLIHSYSSSGAQVPFTRGQRAAG